MDNNARKTIALCPVCGTGHVIEKEQVYACTNRSCGFHIHKEIKRTPISAETARKIIKERKSDVMRFTNASNNPFYARIIRIGAKVCIDFDNEYLKGKGLPPIIMANYLKHAKKKAEETNTEGKKAQDGAGGPEK